MISGEWMSFSIPAILPCCTRLAEKHVAFWLDFLHEDG